MSSEHEGLPVFSLSGMRLKNYKIHKDTGKIDLKPITLLIGPNSSGKSAFLHPLLIKKQTLDISGRSIEPIAINSDLLKLGSFLDIVYEHDDEKNIVFEFYLIDKDNKEYKYSCTIGYDKKNKKIKIFEINFENIKEEMLLIINENNARILKQNIVIAEIPIKKEITMDLVNTITNISLLSSFLGGKDKKIKGTITIGGLEIDVNDDFFIQMRDISFLLTNLNMTFQNMKYIGPLRATPKRYYQISGEKFYTVGIQGERAVEILYDKYLYGEKSIIKNIKKWLKQLKVAQNLKFKKLDKEGNLYSLIITEPLHNIDVNITDVGFGVSQIMPILVESYLPTKKCTIILEQPEIHLHPLAQMVLADVIIDAVKLGKEFIIETHSEHILLRIQRRVSERIINNNNVSIYYFEPKEKDVHIINLEIDENGLIKNIPEGFMDEKLEEAYLIALNESK